MSCCLRTLIGLVALWLVAVPVARGQETAPARDSSQSWHDDAWTRIVERKGVTIDYIYYPEADAKNDGIVLRLTNENGAAVRYAFTVVFRAHKADTSALVRGRLGPGQMKTGDASGLFWVPFKGKDRNVGEIGLRGLEIWPARESRPYRHNSGSGGGVNASWRPPRDRGRAKPSVPCTVNLYDTSDSHLVRTSLFIKQASVSP